MEKILRVNLNDLTVNTELVPPAYHSLGGRALTSRIISDEVKADCEPLGNLNKVVFAPGLLSGTTLPSAGRLSVGAKSPLTGAIKESNVGGTAANTLSKLGIKAIVVEGQAQEGWYVLKISHAGAELLRAEELAGQDNYAVASALHGKHGSKFTVISIGLAGEKVYANSSIAVTDGDGNPCRHAGRGGLGAVLGSKRLKAVIIEPSQGTNFRPSETFSQGVRKLTEAITSHPISGGALSAFGTTLILGLNNELGGLPTRNFSNGKFEGAEKIGAEKLAEVITSRGGKSGHACQPGCVVKCSNVYLDQEGKYLTSGLEYETIALLGSNCGIDDLDAIAQMDRLCDQYGLDTIETGGAIGVAMEAGLLEFGDSRGAINLIEEMGQGTPLGRILGQGVQIAGRVLGAKRIPAVKGQGVPGYDPRAIKGNGVVYATSPMGADHTCGNAIDNTAVDPRKKEGQIALAQELQPFCAAVDAIGMCLFASFALGGNADLVNTLAELINERYGVNWNAQDILNLGKTTLGVEKDFNRRAGFTAAEDKLPEFFRTEILPSTNTVFDIAEEEFQKVF